MRLHITKKVTASKKINKKRIVASDQIPNNLLKEIKDYLEDEGTALVQKLTGGNRGHVEYVEETADSAGDPVMVFEVYGEENNLINTIEAGLGPIDEFDNATQEDMYDIFLDEVKASFV